MTIIKLGGNDLELKFTFERAKTIEGIIGSFYNYTDKCANKTVVMSDVVAIYYHAQEGSAFNEQQIFEKVVKDGLFPHVAQTYDAVMRVILGEDAAAKIEEASKKKETEV